MNAITYNAWNPRHLGFVIVFTALINGSLFAALPWLTHIVRINPPPEEISPYIILPKTQPKPPEPLKDRRIIEQRLQPLPKPPPQQIIRQKSLPDFEYEKAKPGEGGVVINNYVEETISGWKEIIFEPGQLDKEPRAIRKVSPAYPFTAKKQGISARVKIRCLVDIHGMPQKIEAAECDPEDALDIFGPPAVKAVQKWRFSPGEIDGDPVPTRVAFNLFFEMD
jgi:TonB family protein